MAGVIEINGRWIVNNDDLAASSVGEFRKFALHEETERDYQKSAVYAAEFAAERVCGNDIHVVPREYYLPVYAAFYREVISHPDFIRMFGAKTVVLRKNERRKAHVAQPPNTILVALRKRDGFTALDAVHELTHLLVPEPPYHGIAFTSTMLFLSKFAMCDHGRSLIEAFRRFGVKYKIIK